MTVGAYAGLVANDTLGLPVYASLLAAFAVAPLAGVRPLLQKLDKQAQVTAALPIVGEGRCKPGAASGVDVSAFACLGESNFDDLTPSPSIASDVDIYSSGDFLSSRISLLAMHDCMNLLAQGLRPTAHF